MSRESVFVPVQLGQEVDMTFDQRGNRRTHHLGHLEVMRAVDLVIMRVMAASLTLEDGDHRPLDLRVVVRKEVGSGGLQATP